MENIIKVFIADDNYDFLVTLKKYLNEDKEIEVVGEATDGEEAYQKIVQLKPDICLLDVIMPHLDGLGVLERIKENEQVKRPIFLMVSAVGQDKITQKAIALGADYYIVKPFDITLLIQRIKEIKNYNPEELKKQMITTSAREIKAQYITIDDEKDKEN